MHLTFHGKERFKVVESHGSDGHDEHHHEPGVLVHPPKESPWVVTVPLIMLAIPSLLVGYFTVGPMLYGTWFGKAIHVQQAHNVLAEMAVHFHGALSLGMEGFAGWPFVLVVLGFAITTYVYIFNPAMAERIKRVFKPIYVVLDRKFWFDEVYQAVFARGGVKFGRLLWKAGDGAVIDGAIDGSASLVQRIASGLRRLQSGYLYHYAFAMILGLILLLGGFWWFGHV